MQHKRGSSKLGIFYALLAAIVFGGIGVLMSLDVPVQQKPIEKQLDAGPFLEQKQP